MDVFIISQVQIDQHGIMNNITNYDQKPYNTLDSAKKEIQKIKAEGINKIFQYLVIDCQSRSICYVEQK